MTSAAGATNTPSRYELDPCRQDLGRLLHAALLKILPEGGSFAMGPEVISRLLERPRETHLGDYALPCFRFSRDLRRAPPEIASTLAAALPTGDWLVRAEAVGAFVNLTVHSGKVATAIVPGMRSGGHFAHLRQTPANLAQRVMIEYSQPNTHKDLHVGHGRNICLGNALVRLYRACGYQVTSANYFGDDGTHIATVLWYMTTRHPPLPEGDARAKSSWLGQTYVRAKAALAELDEAGRAAATAEISSIHRQVEERRGDVYQLWCQTRQWSLDDFAATYKWLDTAFDVEFFESEMSGPAQAIVDEFLAKGIFVRDQGAIGVDLKAHKLGFCILRKGDGNTLYATKDLALARRKFDEFQVDRSVYVVADEQNHHFRQVFKVLELMGFPQAKQCHHLSYGMVVLPEGKMSSRDGTAVSFQALIQMVGDAIGKIMAKYDGEWPAAEIAATTHRLTDGAIKYGMICTDPTKEIVFNLEDWISFEGNSGPYLMYSYTRTRSILRKATEQGHQPAATGLDLLVHAAEADVLRHLYDYDQIVAAACEGCKPSLLANHLFHLCKVFNRFYAEVPVLKAESEALRTARLALIDAFSHTLKDGLALLGITPPERM